MYRFDLARIQHALDENEETERVLKAVMRDIAKQNRPKKFTPGEGNCLIEHEIGHQEMCAVIEEKYGSIPTTFFEFLSRAESIRKEAQTKSPGLTGSIPQ